MTPTSRHLSRRLEDVETELLIQTFADRILLLITQLGKVGNLIQASIPPTAPLLPASNSEIEEGSNVASSNAHSLPSPPPSIQLTPLLGTGPNERIQTLHSLYTSQAATLVWLSLDNAGGERKPVVVGIALKKAEAWDEVKERRTFMGVMEMLKELLTPESR